MSCEVTDCTSGHLDTGVFNYDITKCAPVSYIFVSAWEWERPQVVDCNAFLMVTSQGVDNQGGLEADIFLAISGASSVEKTAAVG